MNGGDGERGFEEWVDRTVEAMSTLIGKRVAGVAVSPGLVELVFDDCDVLSIRLGAAEAIEVYRLSEGECRCLRKCLEAHGLATEATQKCMDECLEEVYGGEGGG